MTTITNNVLALRANHQVGRKSALLQTSVRHLSTGKRIANAADDASGLAVGTGLRAQRAALNTMRQTAQQAASILQVADGSLSSISGIISEMTVLATQAASDQISNSERSLLDVEYQELKQAVDDTIAATSFNGVRLLGEKPDFRIGFTDPDVDVDDGFVGYSFTNGNAHMGDGDVYELAYNSAGNYMTLTNTTRNAAQTISMPPTPPGPGELREIHFSKLGVRITLSDDFNSGADIDPAVQQSTFSVVSNSTPPPTFLPTDLPNLVMWLSADDSPLNILGGGVQSVGDLEVVTGGSNDATQGSAGARPTVASGVVFGNNALSFDGNDTMVVANHSTLNLATHSKKSYAMSFRTGGDVTSRQMIYEEGAQVNGMNAYVQNGRIYMGVWRSNGGNAAFISAPVAANTSYTASYSFDATTNTVTGYLNGAQFSSAAAIGANLPSHSGGIGIGAVNGQSREHTGGTTGGGNYFTGEVAEMVYYNDAFTPADHANLDGYLRAISGDEALGSGKMSFQVADSEDFLSNKLVYTLPRTDRVTEQLSSTNVLSATAAKNAITNLESSRNMLMGDRSTVGAMASRVEFAIANLEVSSENLASAYSSIMDADIAVETTLAASRMIMQSLAVDLAHKANKQGEVMLNLLS